MNDMYIIIVYTLLIPVVQQKSLKEILSRADVVLSTLTGSSQEGTLKYVETLAGICTLSLQQKKLKWSLRKMHITFQNSMIFRLQISIYFLQSGNEFLI